MEFDSIDRDELLGVTGGQDLFPATAFPDGSFEGNGGMTPYYPGDVGGSNAPALSKRGQYPNQPRPAVPVVPTLPATTNPPPPKPL
jgi:hypothetical protein